MLIQILFTVFMLAGLTALYVDLGVARLTQIQMQNAADAAAIEGLRQPHGTVPEDEMRRDTVVNFVAASGAYEPPLQKNLANLPEGDMLPGDYDATQFHSEGSDYTRPDFASSESGDAFLVRLRRTNEGDAADIRSNGAATPFLFGHSLAIGYNPAMDGIAVRATAIAAPRTALRVGPASNGIPGTSNVSVSRSCWASMVASTTPRPLLTVCGPPLPLYTAAAASTVGLGVTPSGGSPLETDGAYLPVFDPTSTCPTMDDPDAHCIVGFGMIQVDSTGRITAMPGRIASQNATGLLPGGLPGGFSLLSPAEGALQVAVLAR